MPGVLGGLPRVSAALLGFARLVGLLAYQSFGSHGVFGRRSQDGEHSLTSVWPGCVWWEPSSLLADSFNKCCCHIDWGMRRVASGVGLFCGDSPLSCILLASCSGLLICLIPHFLPGIPASLLRSCLLADLPTYSACPCQTCRPTSLSPTCVVWWVLNDFAS